MSYDDASARCQVKARSPNEIYELILARPSAVSEVRDDGGCEIKKWRAIEEGGTLQCPPDRSSRPLTLRTESGWLGGASDRRVPEPFAPK